MESGTYKKVAFVVGTYGLAYLGWGWRGLLAWYLVNVSLSAFVD